MPLTILCTVGIPGSGKTTLSRNLVQCKGGAIKYIHICFDELQCLSCLDSAEHHDLDGADTSLTPYKLFRCGMLHLVESLVQHIKYGHSLTIPELVNTVKVQQYITSQVTSLTAADCVCVLVDDLMYYSSMRYPYYQLARQYNIGFGEVYVNTPLEVCVKRNSLRHGDERVDESTILRVKDKLEPPLPSTNLWEKHSIECQLSASVDILSFIKTCINNPVAARVTGDEREREASAKITTEDVLHQSDLICRQLVKLYVMSAVNDGSVDVKSAASNSNQSRKLVLAYIKTRSAELSTILSTTHPQCNPIHPQSNLYQFIQEKFHQYLNSG